MSGIMPPAPAPKTPLARYRLLSPTASVRVSPLCLGAMNLGTAWGKFLGEVNKEESFALLDHFYEAGGNFIDTANNYQSEESETWIGEWMAKRGNRDEMVIATKFTSAFKTYEGYDKKIQANFTGNGAKSLRVSVEHSLKKLQTDYIDVLYIHWWDWTTGIEELMLSLNDLVKSGKVMYLGVSDTPAWVVSKANQYARDHGLRQFVVYQGRWNAASRDFERDIIPMVQSEGMGIAPWGALGGGSFKTKEQREAKDGRPNPRMDVNAEKVCEVLEKLAKEKGTIMTSIALAYVMHKTPYVFPIVGGRKIDHIQGNIEALKIALSDAEVKEIEDASPFDVGFPMSMIRGPDPSTNDLTQHGATYDFVKAPHAIVPSSE